MIEKKEAQRFLVDLVHQAANEIGGYKTLDVIERGEMPPEKWRTFAEQRYLAALPFTDLLAAGIAAAKEMGDTELATALEANWRDEMGITTDGVQHQEMSHETWRRDFYKALGVSQEALQKAEPFAGTQAYSRALEDLMANKDALSIAGALLVLEGSIPVEFKRIQTGRDKTFAHTFVDQSGASEEAMQQKAKARLYIDDHIAHDTSSHYPDLLKALEKYALGYLGPTSTERIKSGADGITEAKGKFYQDLEQKLM